MKYLFAAIALLALGAVAKANCYEHCHRNSNGDWVCHTNCY